jgi:hypothetical protein
LAYPQATHLNLNLSFQGANPSEHEFLLGNLKKFGTQLSLVRFPAPMVLEWPEGNFVETPNIRWATMGFLQISMNISSIID